jgi:protein phosphatase
LTNEISDEEIERVLSTLVDPTAAAEDLVRRANAHGGSDNISVVIIDAVIAEGTGESTAAHRIVTAPAATASTPKRETAPRGIGAIPPPPVGRREGWLARRRRLGVQRAVTFRVLMFLVLLVGVLAGAWYFLRWYATSAYYVTAEGESIVIYQGRPGGVLWFQPQLVTGSATPLDQVLATRRPALRNDVAEPTLQAAKRYVANLADEYRQSQAAIPPTVVVAPTTTIPIPTPTVSPPITSAPGAIVTYPTLPG